MAVEKHEKRKLSDKKKTDEENVDEEKKNEIKEFKNAQDDWRINCAYIGSRINAYFYDEKNIGIINYWDSYYQLIIKFYELT